MPQESDDWITGAPPILDRRTRDRRTRDRRVAGGNGYRANGHAAGGLADPLGDAACDGIALCDSAGRVLQWTAALRRVLDADPDGHQVTHEIARLVRTEMSDPAAPTSADPASRRVGRPAALEVTTAAATYRLRTAPLDAARHNADTVARPSVAVVIELLPRTAGAGNTTPVDAAAAARLMRVRHGLTDREVDVALLLKEGYANKEIAGALGISSHTVRHHLTSIMAKMHIHCRSAVAVAVLQMMLEASDASDATD